MNEEVQTPKKMGRPRGVSILRANPRAQELLATGISPLEVMLHIMRESWLRICSMKECGEYENDEGVIVPVTMSAFLNEEGRCFAYAQQTAPYCHAKLTEVKNSPSEDGPYRITIQKEDANL